jgi:hypothetical protein
MRGSILPAKEVFGELSSVEYNCFKRGIILVPSSFSNSNQYSSDLRKRRGTKASVLCQQSTSWSRGEISSNREASICSRDGLEEASAILSSSHHPSPH